MDLMRLSNIADYLALEKDLGAAVRYVALNACSSGEPSRFYVSRLDGDFKLSHVSSFGFDEGFLARNSEFSLLTNPLLNEAINSESVIIKSRDAQYRKDFAGLQVSEGDEEWKSTIFMPLLPNFAATLSTRVQTPDKEQFRNYYSMLKSLFSLYIHQLDGSQNSRRRGGSQAKENLIGQQLTERQSLILDLIKSGMTNIAIAHKMGYSESLIRQETMAIYQKLGIDGRKDLTRTELLNEGSND